MKILTVSLLLVLQSEVLEVGEKQISEIVEIDPGSCSCILPVVCKPDIFGEASSSSSWRRGGPRSSGVPRHFLLLPTLPLHSVLESKGDC